MQLVIFLFSLFIPLYLFCNPLPFHTFQADFEQKVSSENAAITYRGIIRGQSPDLLRWDYTEPVEKSIYVTDNRVIVVEPLLEQAILTELDRSIDMYAILKQSIQQPQDFNLTIQHTIYQISPSANSLPKSIAYTDTLGNEILITTHSVNLDISLDPQLFHVTLPEHYDILRQ